MKRIFMSTTLALMFLWATVSPGAGSNGRRSATVMIHLTRVAIGVGFTKGEGYLRYKGDDFKFQVTGLSAMGLGVTTLNATGEVYNLLNLDDFPGTYFGFEGGGTFIEGSKGLVLKNNKGVVLNLKAEQQGMDLKLGNEGLKISPAWE